MVKIDRGISLIELIISMVIMSLVILGFFSIELFSRHHVISSDRRAKVQNEISYAIEYISKYVQQSPGDSINRAISVYPSGFQVRRNLYDPTSVINFYLSGNSLIAQEGASTEVLTARISGAYLFNAAMPAYPDRGFYVMITEPGPNQGMAVDIGLVGRWDPAAAASPENPQIAMKTRLLSPSSSAQ